MKKTMHVVVVLAASVVPFSVRVVIILGGNGGAYGGGSGGGRGRGGRAVKLGWEDRKAATR